MAKFRRAFLAAEAVRRNREQLARLGGEIRAATKRRRLTQAALGALVGLSQTTISRLELGLGGGLTVDTWQRVATALDLPLRLELGRDSLADVRDAGHLAIQGSSCGPVAKRASSGSSSLRRGRPIQIGLVMSDSEATGCDGCCSSRPGIRSAMWEPRCDPPIASWPKPRTWRRRCGGNATTLSPVAGSSDRPARTAPCSRVTRSCSRLDSPGRRSAGWPLSRRDGVLRFGPVSSGVTLARRVSLRRADFLIEGPDRLCQKSGCVRG